MSRLQNSEGQQPAAVGRTTDLAPKSVLPVRLNFKSALLLDNVLRLPKRRPLAGSRQLSPQPRRSRIDEGAFESVPSRLERDFLPSISLIARSPSFKSPQDPLQPGTGIQPKQPLSNNRAHVKQLLTKVVGPPRKDITTPTVTTPRQADENVRREPEAASDFLGTFALSSGHRLAGTAPMAPGIMRGESGLSHDARRLSSEATVIHKRANNSPSREARQSSLLAPAANAQAVPISDRPRAEPSSAPGSSPVDDDNSRNTEDQERREEHAELHIDGTLLGQWVVRHLEEVLTKPPTGPSFVDQRLMPVYPGRPLAI